MRPLKLLDDLVGRLRGAGCVFAEDEVALLIGVEPDAARLEEMVAARCSGMPLEHILGWADFAGVRVIVTAGVFVPRPRSELLVERAVELVRPGDILVDMCCGSGAVGVAILERVGDIDLHACDDDPAAIGCARRNVEPGGGHVYMGDLDTALPAGLHGRVDMMVANAPYVPTAAIPLLPHEAKDYEPLTALDGGTDGLDLQRRIVEFAPRWLTNRGHLLIETSDDQAARTAALMTDAGFSARIARSEEHDATVAIGMLGHRLLLSSSRHVRDRRRRGVDAPPRSVRDG